MTPAVLYELIAAADIAIMLVLGVLVVSALRWLLRGWRSTGWKLLVVHLPVLPLLFFGLPALLGPLILLRYAGLTNASILCVWLGLLLADGVRVWSKDVHGLRVWRWPGVAMVFLAGALLARLSCQSAAGIEGLTQAREFIAVQHQMETDPPGREVLPILRAAFPSDYLKLVAGQAARLRTAVARGPNVLVSDFPSDDFNRFLISQQRDIAHAPDGDLISIARAAHDAALFMTPAECAAAVAAPSQPAPLNQRESLGRLYSAYVIAARDGRDHPVNRPPQPTRIEALTAALASSLSGRLRTAPGTATAMRDKCELASRLMQWIGGLSDQDAIVALSARAPVA